jgi:phage/conjugal plasmid C-4 type zinc finger TraR family protein
MQKENMKVREKKNLLKKYSELRAQIIRTLENSDYEIDIDGDAVDQLQGQSLVNIQNRLSKNNLTKLRIIDEAIEMISRGEYGDCSECGEPIEVKRLEAIPGVTICVCCAELSEVRR